MIEREKRRLNFTRYAAVRNLSFWKMPGEKKEWNPDNSDAK
jgi:hypothetical protein